MTEIKKLLDEARDSKVKEHLNQYSPATHAWKHSAFCAGFDANKEIIVELVRALEYFRGHTDPHHVDYANKALAKVEARLRGMNE